MTFSDKDEEGKLFVGGLSWETTQEKLKEYFSRYGEVTDSVVMKNVATGRSRGFGFITFADPSVIQLVLSAGPHNLDGKSIDPKSCTPRSQQKPKSDSFAKLFLGGLPPDITETDLRSAFSRFGKVQEVNIMYDQEKRKSRGFGFLSFESEDATHQACTEHYVDVNGKQIECKLAVPRDSTRRRFPQSQGQHYSPGWSRMMPPQNSWSQMPPMNPPPSYQGWGGAGVAAGPPPPQQQAYDPNGTSAGSYSSGYQGYTAPAQPTTYSAYTAAAAPNAYSQSSYASYSGAGQAMPAAPSSTPAATYASTAPSATDYSGASYGLANSVQPVRGYTQQQQQQQGYHPYRR